MIDVLTTVLCAVIIIGFLVFIHEGGHYLTARMFGVRVTEFMIGLPGPNIGVTRNGTKFGLTAIPLGGYARICGMETGKEAPHIREVLASLYTRGTATMEEVAFDCGISDDAAYEALEELAEWGSVIRPKKSDKYNTYRTPELIPTKRDRKFARKMCVKMPETLPEGSPRTVENADFLYRSEFRQQYRALPFWKRSVVILAGIAVNLIFAIAAFVFIYTVVGFDYTSKETGELLHFNATPLQSLQLGLSYIAMVFQAILNLFNPQTAAQTVSESSSIVGIAIMSKNFIEQSLMDGLFFTAAISVSIGLMNLLPIPPLDGGRFLIEIIQKVTRREVPMKVLGYVSAAGMLLFLGFFVFMLNQDIQRFILGNW